MRISDSPASTLTPADNDANTQGSTAASDAPHPSSSPPAPTPQQRVDNAVAQYDAALKSKDSPRIAQAQKEVYASVAAEIGPQLAAANAHIPSQYQTADFTQQQITSYGNNILRRYQNDPAAQTVLKGAVADYQLQAQANSLIPSFYGNFTPQEKLDALKSALQGAPPEVAERAMQSPAVQQMLKDAVKWIAQPYTDGSHSVSASEDQQAALTSSQRLAAITRDLPAAYAQQVVQQSMPTIQKIAGVDANFSGSGAFGNLSNTVANLGSGPQAQALTQQIAQAYRGQVNTWAGRFEDPNGGIVRNAVGSGADPKLSLALASQLQASGNSTAAGAVVRSAERGIEQLQEKVGQDVKAYQDQTKDLDWAVASSQGKLDPSQMQKAIGAYISNQPQKWRDQFQNVQNQLVADTEKLNKALGEMQGISGGPLAKAAPDAFAALKQNVGGNKTTQQALEFTASRDPGLFAGPDASEALDFWADVGGRSRNLTEELANSYIASNVLPGMKHLDTNDPKSVAQFQRTLDQLKTKLTKLGVPETDVKNGVGQLEKILHTVQAFGSPSATVRDNALQATQKQLGELKEMPFSSGSLAASFRTVAFALSGVAALSQDKKTLSDPSVQNLIGSLGLNVGAVQDGTAFAAKLSLIDQDGSAGAWGAAASKAGGATAKFVGFLDAAYFTAGSIKAYQSGDIPSTVVNGIGAGGAALAAFGEAAGLGAWAGPVGVGVTILAAAGVELTQHSHEVAEHTEVEENFLKGAGLTEDVAKTLSSDAAQEATTVQQRLKLSPDQLQSLAAAHPEVFNSGPGYTQAVISFANANGIKGQDVKGFLDAAQKDDPNYTQRFFNLNQALAQAGHPLTQQAAEFRMIAQTFPNAARYVQQHSPEMVGPAADARRQAGVDYENAAGSINSQMSIANLLKAHHEPAYQAEIVKIMKDNGTLASFVNSVGNEYAYNGWPQAAQSGIRAAESGGVLTQPQARQYLQELS